MSCRTEARVERNSARASPFSTCVPRAATATRLLNRVLGVYGYSGFRRESKITREVDHKRRRGHLCFGYAPLADNLQAGKLILPFQGEAACHCVVQGYYVPVEIIPAKPN